MDEKDPKRDAKRGLSRAKIVPRSDGHQKIKNYENCTGASTGAPKSEAGLIEKATIWEPNVIKKRVRIEVKMKIDFEFVLVAKMEPTWSPKDAKMDAKSAKKRSNIEANFCIDFGCNFCAIRGS